MLYHLSKVELGRLGQLVPRFTKLLTMGERMAWVRFLQLVYSLSWSLRLKRKKRNTFKGIPSILKNFHQVEPFHLTFHPKKQQIFSVQMVSALGVTHFWIFKQSFSDCESITDYSGMQEYMLQCCHTDNKGNSDAVFSTVYSGEDTSHLVNDLEPHVSYTFRVCGRFGNEGKWSSWSIPRNCITTLHPHGLCC